MNAQTVPSLILYGRGEMGKRKLPLIFPIAQNLEVFVCVFGWQGPPYRHIIAFLLRRNGDEQYADFSGPPSGGISLQNPGELLAVVQSYTLGEATSFPYPHIVAITFPNPGQVYISRYRLT